MCTERDPCFCSGPPICSAEVSKTPIKVLRRRLCELPPILFPVSEMMG
jgi:hypothetical protein